MWRARRQPSLQLPADRDTCLGYCQYPYQNSRSTIIIITITIITIIIVVVVVVVVVIIILLLLFIQAGLGPTETPA